MTQGRSPSDPAGHAALVSLLVAIGIGNLLAIHCWFGPRLTQHPPAAANNSAAHTTLSPTTTSASAPIPVSSDAPTLTPAADGALVPDLYFERDEHSLHSGHLLLIAHAVEHLRANPKQRVVVRACTDGTGPDDWNEVLRRKRALGVVRVLRSHGIEQERIVVERCASGSEGSRDEDPRHRRVELRTR